jgi:ATP-dependent DNA helicase RecG
MVLTADLDHSVIDELPPGRKPIDTNWLRQNEVERAYQFIRHRVSRGEQAYIVFPLVEESEAVQAKAAVAEFEKLSSEVFPEHSVGLVHGRMPSAEKEAVMSAFGAGEIQILVATSVIEVGVDVPNATVMLIEGADRFGLAQLHQFRGRVGRGHAESACLLVADAKTPAARDRLEAVVSTTNGLELAERDLQIRGPGDYFGVQQSGLVDRFRFARSASTETLLAASSSAEVICEADPELARPEHRALANRVEDFVSAFERA